MDGLGVVDALEALERHAVDLARLKAKTQQVVRFGAEVFASLNNKLLALKAQGKTIYNMSVGTPDFKPYDHVVEALTQAAQDPEMWKYALRDLPELKQAVCDYYERRFGVSGITPSMG